MNGMSKKLRKNVNRAMNLLNDYQQDKYDKVQRKEDLIDKYERRLGDYLIQLWIPAGRELALKTFNPKLGIEGGISILGTTGIVNPMSEQALMDTIRLEIHMRAVAGEHSLILAPGNYGERFLSEHLGIAIDQAVT